ncbi:dimethylamine monooxygenase subunit DmmA family protein [Sutcliffiella horikoshii]|uniref:dimethylamine monooxygenase subunit DmmA family protein n=1 Tax=Sutcliffiella horikoshii TaxID=79883 RepID=UPI003CF1F7F3
MNDIKNEPIFQPGKKHYVLCGDEEGLDSLSPIKMILSNEKMSFEEIHLLSECSSEVDRKLERQKMGTFLYVAAEGNKLRKVLSMATKLGYSPEEAQYIMVEKEEKRIFCCRCHVISIVCGESIKRGILNCPACSLKLELSDHYSPIKDAYLGYVAEV